MCVCAVGEIIASLRRITFLREKTTRWQTTAETLSSGDGVSLRSADISRAELR